MRQVTSWVQGWAIAGWAALLVGCHAEPKQQSGEEHAVSSSAALVVPAIPVGSVQVPAPGGNVSVAVYDSTGQQVRVLSEAVPTSSGTVSIAWNGQDEFGNLLPAGTYRWKALVSSATAVDEGSIGQGASPSYGSNVFSQSANTVAVDPSGNVYESSYWEEFHQELRSWTSDGQRRWGGQVSNLGAALAADDAYVYVAQELNGENRVVRFSNSFSATATSIPPTTWSGQPVTGYIRANATGGHGVFGLAVDANTLWVSNHAQNKIQRYDKATGAFVGDFVVNDPHGIAADGSGRVWVSNGTDRVTLFSSSGSVVSQLTGLNRPFAVAFGGPSAHLYVGEAGSGQVKEFVPGTLALVRTLFGRALPGPVRDDRLRWPDTVDSECTVGCSTVGGGLAVDASGRLVVADPGNGRVLVYTADGSLLATRFNGYANAPQVDPNVDPALVLSGALEYSVDYSSGASYGEWTLANNWRPSGLDVSSSFSNATLHRKLSNGREYIYSFVGPSVFVYQIQLDRSLRLSAVIGKDASGLYNAADADANGAIASSEKVAKAGTVSYVTHAPGLWADGAGNVFIANGSSGGVAGALFKLPLRGFDAANNPLYDWDDVTSQPPLVPPDTTFWKFAATNVRVDPVNGDIYRIGSTTQAPGSSVLWMGGSTVERRTMAGDRSLFFIGSNSPYPNFSCGNPCVAAIATDTDGNYFYTGQSGVQTGGQVLIKMFTTDGLMVAQAVVGAANGNESGWIDGGFGLTAFTSGATHYVYSEDSYYGRAVRFRVDGVSTLQRLNPMQGTPFEWNPSTPAQVVSVTPSVAHTLEGTTSTPGTFTFTRTDSRGDLAVSYATSGSATPGTDYTALSGTLVIPNGSFSATVSVAAKVDTANEGPESVNVTVTSGSAYSAGTPSAATITIHEQSIVSVSAAPSSIPVQGPGATYTLARSNSELGMVAQYTLGPPLVPIASSTASSHYGNGGLPSKSYDGNNASMWSSFGNSDHEGDDDTPSITYTFADVRSLGLMRVSNYNGGEVNRGVRRADILVSTDGVTFTLLKSTEFQPGVASGAPRWQEIDLQGASALAVQLQIKTNWFNKAFYQGTSYEGAWANASITGLSEVQFYERGASPADILPVSGNSVVGHLSFGSVTFAAGQATATVSITPRDSSLVNQPPKPLELRLVDSGAFSLGSPSAASVTITNDHTGPVVSLTAPNPSAVRGGAPGVFRFSRTGSTASPLTVSYTTATVPVMITSSGASSYYPPSTPALSYDGRADTVWQSAGNSDHEGHDDTPFVTYSFDDVVNVGRMRVSNYNGYEVNRGAKHVDISVSTDGINFIPVGGTLELELGVPGATSPRWQDFDLGNVPARIVKIAVLDNWYGRVFYQGTSYEGAWANRSITGISEAQFFTGSTAPASAFPPGSLSGTIVIPAGQTSVDLSLSASSTSSVGGTLTLTVTSDDTVYSVGAPSSATLTIVDQVLATPVPISSTTVSSVYWGRNVASVFDGDLMTVWPTYGNSDHEGEDDTPFIQFTFDKVYALGTLRVSNYNGYEHHRSAKDVEVLVSTDGTNFSSLGTTQFTCGSPAAAGAVWQNIELYGAQARVVKLAIRSNWYGRTFYQGTSYEGAWANRSITGLSEVQFFAALPISSTTASSTYPGRQIASLFDGGLTSVWATHGNSDHEGHDDTPSIQFNFDQVYSVGTMRVSNYNGYEHHRSAKDVEVLVSTDGTNFSSLGMKQFTNGSPTAAGAIWQDIELNSVQARAVKLAIRSNWYGRDFYQGTSYEGAWANRSITGLSEVQFFAPHP